MANFTRQLPPHRVNDEEVIRGAALCTLYACEIGYATNVSDGSKYTKSQMKAIFDVEYELTDAKRVSVEDLDGLITRFRVEPGFAQQVGMEMRNSGDRKWWSVRVNGFYQRTPE